MKTIVFIGYGNIAKALAPLFAQAFDYKICASAPSLQEGQNAEDIFTHPDNKHFISEADCIFLAVKPFMMETVLKEIPSQINKKTLVVSLAAGVSIATMSRLLPEGQAIIRSMPNTAIAQGKGATAFFANAATSKEQKDWLESLFKPTGLSTWVSEEGLLDAFTAVSGSGPAYVYLFLEAMTEAALQLGLDPDIAKSFVFQTAEGAIHLAKTKNLPLEDLRNQVTSKGGTTAAALEYLQKQDFKNILIDAIKTAQKRAKELGT